MTKALVTGGTSGLGPAMASALAAAGAAVALTGRTGRRAEGTAAGLPGAIGLEPDVRDEASVARAVDPAWSRLGGIDLLVSNAGLGVRTVNPRFMTRPRGFWEVPPDAFRAVVDTNLTGYFLVARPPPACCPRMTAPPAGSSSTPPSWARPSSGSPPRRPPASTTNASSPPTSPGGSATASVPPSTAEPTST
ncbi:SDR family NAD(P)-dependent oxidoreductase [Kitasatospora sp. NPDC057541]|uniref:SDR family NAD(P)-dependent oxidoreductase n=1 Tax=unclassified Kitasatospora TaxID=2633591 RepID=UPI0036ACEC6C